MVKTCLILSDFNNLIILCNHEIYIFENFLELGINCCKIWQRHRSLVLCVS